MATKKKKLSERKKNQSQNGPTASDTEATNNSQHSSGTISSGQCFQPLFLVAMYNTMDIRTKIMTYKEVMALDLESYHCCLADCIGKMGFRTGNGWQEFEIRGRFIQTAYRRVLIAMMFHPGIRLDRGKLVKHTGLTRLFHPGELPTFINRIRKPFCESKDTAEYINSYNVGVLKLEWPVAASWICVKEMLPSEIASVAKLLEKNQGIEDTPQASVANFETMLEIMKIMME